MTAPCFVFKKRHAHYSGDGGQPLGFAVGGAADAGAAATGLLGRWRENLAVLAANPAAGADRTISRLGFRLACERGEVSVNAVQGASKDIQLPWQSM